MFSAINDSDDVAEDFEVALLFALQLMLCEELDDPLEIFESSNSQLFLHPSVYHDSSASEKFSESMKNRLIPRVLHDSKLWKHLPSVAHLWNSVY